jgi:predicted AAA+ superfamily ATPase
METADLKESLYFYNPWWETGKVPSELLKTYHRPVVNVLRSFLSIDRIIVLKGPRRTGKTTVLYQIVDNLLKAGVSARDILFLSFDDIKLRIDLDEILKVYQQLNRRLIKEGSTVYIFMDEVHFLENWQFYVKKYFDRKYSVKFLISGSAATLIKRGTESLAGRTVEEILYPFSFYEFLSLRIKNKKPISIINMMREDFRHFSRVNINDLTPHVTEIKIAFEVFSEKGGFPNLFSVDEPILWKRLVREDIIEKVIYRDMVELYDIKKPEVLERLFLYLTDITSGILSVANIANSLGLSREYTEKYLFYLEQAFLIRRINKYARSVEKSIRAAGKVHIIDAGLINAFSKVEIGQVIETLAVNHLMRLKDADLYYFRERYEVDIVLEMGKSLYPIEIKYKNNITRQDIRGIEGFCKKFGTKKAIIVSRDLLKEEPLNGCMALFIPAWLFISLIG